MSKFGTIARFRTIAKYQNPYKYCNRYIDIIDAVCTLLVLLQKKQTIETVEKQTFVWTNSTRGEMYCRLN